MSQAAAFPSANEAYISSFDKGSLTLPPAKALIVVTCMDARIEPLAQLGLNLGDAHVIRNAGGSATEALRSIVISQRLLGTREIAVFRHTNCGMLTFTNEQLREKVIAEAPGNTKVADAVHGIDFLPFPIPEDSVLADVRFLQAHPLVLKETSITGWIYEVSTGKAKKVV